MQPQDKIYFGRTQGEKTLGEVIKINRVSVKVKQLESRGTFKSYPVGTIWKVHVSLCSPAPAGVVPVVESQGPAAPIARRDERVILRDIQLCYGELSPENLSCDGELSRTAQQRRAAGIRARLRVLFNELGRQVSEDDAFRLV